MAFDRVAVASAGHGDSGVANCSSRKAGMPTWTRCAIDCGVGPKVDCLRKRPLVLASGSRIVTVAVPVSLPAATALGAVYSPLLAIVPSVALPPVALLTCQVTA